MTREEALKILKYRSGWNLSIRDVNALDMAIKALEQESESICKYGVLHKIAEFFQNWNGDETAKMEISVNDMREIADVYGRKARIERQLKEIRQEPCEAISREALLNGLANIAKAKAKSDAQKALMGRVIFFAEQLPPVQPKPKTGHWIYEKRKRLINETDEGAEYVTDYWCKCSKCGGDFGYRKMKDAFCKYCGAKMVKPQERSDKE